MSRLKIRAALASVIAVFSLTIVGACPAIAAGGGLAGKSAQEVVSIARTAAEAKGSVHSIHRVEYGNVPGTEIFDLTKTEGKEVDSGPTFGNGKILVIKGVAYIMGDAFWLEPQLTNTQAATYAGKWIAFHKGDKESAFPPPQTDYNFYAFAETLMQQLTYFLPVAPYSAPEFTTLNGRKVVKIVGGVRKSPFGSTGVGTNTTYVSTSPPYLPVESVI